MLFVFLILALLILKDPKMSRNSHHYTSKHILPLPYPQTSIDLVLIFFTLYYIIISERVIRNFFKKCNTSIILNCFSHYKKKRLYIW